METLWNDLRFSVRTLRKTPGFTCVAVLILALGIGATTAIFSVVNAVLLRPLPYKDPAHLVAFSRLYQQGGKSALFPTVSLNEVEEFRRQSATLESIGSFVFTQLPVKVGEQSWSVVTGGVDPELLTTLGTSFAMGRNFSGSGSTKEDNSAIISHKLWVEAFHSDPAVIGRPVNVDGDLYTVTGVLPAAFQFPRADASYFTENVDLLIPVANIAEGWGKDSPQWFAIGRLSLFANIDQAQAELKTISTRLAAQSPKEKNLSVRLAPLNEETTRTVRPALLLVMGISIVLLLIACTNIMNLLFSRSANRGREMAVRKAVGASTMRLVRQMLTESACLTFFAGALGLVLARLVLDALVSLSPVHLPISGSIQIDPSVLGFAFFICTLATLAAGFIPALHSGRQREDLLGGTGTRASGGRMLARMQRGLMVTQVALGLGLLTTASLLVHSLWRLSSVDPGFRREGVIGFELTTPHDHPVAQNAQLYQRILDAMRGIPGVTSSGWITNLPPESRKGMFVPFTIPSHAAQQPPAQRLFCNFQVTSEDYFSTVGIPFLRGRGFTPADGAGAPPVVIINEMMAKRYFPNEDPIGQKIQVFFDKQQREIVGIIKPIHDRGLDSNTVETAYAPFKQYGMSYGSIVVRAQVPPQSLIPEIRARISNIDSGIPITGFQTLDERIRASLDEPRFYTLMAGACAFMAVLFVTLGLYGVVAYSVARRTPEIGIRMALGAQRGAILRMVLKQGLGLAAIGTVIGMGLSLFATRIFTTLLFEVKPDDPWAFVSAAALIVVVTLLASYVPARRASRVDPMVALHYE